MSFRRQRDDWDEFLTRHRLELLECGLPHEVVTDKWRFLRFLDEGFDQDGWAVDRVGYFHSRFLADDQIERLGELVGSEIDEKYRTRITSRWTSW